MQGEAYRRKGMYAEAIAAFRETEPVLGRPSAWRAAVHAELGERDEALAVVGDLEKRIEQGEYLPPESIALVYAVLGDEDRAFEWLERGVAVRSAIAPVTAFFPELQPLMATERYRPLRETMGLP